MTTPSGTPSCESRTLVTVDGVDGSGKSVFARRLVAALGPSARLLAVDDFRRPVDWARGDRPEIDLYYDERYDLDALDACARAFLSGEPGCAYHGFDGAREVLGPLHPISFEGIQLLVVEGVFAARLATAAHAVSLYIDISLDESRRRVLARDTRKGRTPEEVQRRLSQRYLPAHARYQAAFRPSERATLVIDNNDVDRPRVVRGALPDGTALVSLRAALGTLMGTDRI